MPAVDDGAIDIEESRAGLEMPRSQGVREIITTPHLRGSLTDRARELDGFLAALDEAWASLESLAESEFPDMRIERGVEPMLDIPRPNLEDPRLRLAGTSYALVEFPFMAVPELERRGHCFVRYADDCNVYVGSRRAGDRVLSVLRQRYAKLRLRINEEKSAVARVWNRKLLGYSFWVPREGPVKLRVAPDALAEMKRNVRGFASRSGGRSMTQVCSKLGRYLRGWKEYFKLADTPKILSTLDGWIHRRLRALQLKHWKRGRTASYESRRRGLPEWLVRKGSGFARRWWWAAALSAAHAALPGAYFERLGVPRLVTRTSTL